MEKKREGCRIVHIADTHIKNLKYHSEYREVFAKLYEEVKQAQPDCIVHCGDLAHTKTQLSPEYFEMAAAFLKNLADISPTIIILGNHDCNIKNKARQDAITPIVETLRHNNLKLFKDSCEYKFNDDITFIIKSILQEEGEWLPPTDPEKINIALYHGAINGVKTDTGYTLDNGDYDESIFEGCDYALLGDIHKTNQFVGASEKYRYPGSTVQQNFGESDDKGFLIWDIISKSDYTVRHVEIKNPTPFITIKLPESGILPELKVQAGSRMRIVGTSKVTLEQLRNALEVAESRYKPEALTFFNKVGTARNSVRESVDGFEIEDMRDIAVQEKLIKEYLNDYRVDDEVMQRILELNRKYNTEVEQSEDTLRNIKWRLKELTWDNLFNYGTGNRLNFDKLKGVVGIFGKNFSGKSSIIDSFLWTLQNSTSKNVRKNVDIINQNESYGCGMVKLEVDGNIYTIERSAEKYIKKLKGEETEEAKTDVQFLLKDAATGRETKLNGNSRNETDKEIRRHFGSIEDFLLTSMTSQEGGLSFINEGSTKRKEILGKFLDLDIYAKKHKLATEDAAKIKGALDRLKRRDLKQEERNVSSELEWNVAATKQQKGYCDNIREQLRILDGEELEIIKEISASPKLRVFNLEEEEQKLEEARKLAKILTKRLEDSRKESEGRESVLSQINDLIQKVDIEKEKEKQAQKRENVIELQRILREIEKYDAKRDRENKKQSLLAKVPCGDRFLGCMFLTDAQRASKESVTTDGKLTILNEAYQNLANIDRLLGPDNGELLKEYEKLRERATEESTKLSALMASETIDGMNLDKTNKEIKTSESDLFDYRANKEEVEKLKSLYVKQEECRGSKSTLEAELASYEEELLELYKNHGSLEHRLQVAEELQGELSDLHVQYSAYDLYNCSMHSNGISYDVIKGSLPTINNEISKVLANVVDFQVFFEEDGKKLDILIKHPKFEARPLELGSGAEKMLSAMAIRLSLIKISNLPQGDLFILDEPATALDEENMEGFVRIIEMLKTQFKTVLIISHLDALKDIVDLQIDIDKVDKCAHVEN